MRGVSGRQAAVFALVIALALIALLPLRLALGWAAGPSSAVTARQAEGTIWSGRLRDMHVGRLGLGDVSARLVPLALLGGRMEIRLDRPGAADALSGRLVLGRTGAIEDVTARLATADVLAPLPVAHVVLNDVTVRIGADGCRAAEGRVSAELPPALAAVTGGVLSGSLRCDGAAVLLPLQSPSGTSRIALRFEADGRYSGDLTLPQAAGAGGLSGLTPAGDGLMMRVSGRL